MIKTILESRLDGSSMTAWEYVEDSPEAFFRMFYKYAFLHRPFGRHTDPERKVLVQELGPISPKSGDMFYFRGGSLCLMSEQEKSLYRKRFGKIVA